MRRTLLAACVAFLVGPANAQRIEASRPLMGTAFRIVVEAQGAPDSVAQAAIARALDRVAALERIASDYDPDSEVNRLHQAGGGRASPDLTALLAASARWHRATHGAFDPALGNLTRLWRHAARRGTLPADTALVRARTQSGWHLVHMAGDSLLLESGVRLDLGGIAKGFAADEALAVLSAAGFPCSLVDAGGDIRVGCGRWCIGLPGEGKRTVQNLGVASSGDRFRGFATAGGRVSHILDPESGEGLTGGTTVTVIAESATAADALASALSVLGPVRGAGLAAQLGAEVLFQQEH